MLNINNPPDFLEIKIPKEYQGTMITLLNKV